MKPGRRYKRVGRRIGGREGEIGSQEGDTRG